MVLEEAKISEMHIISLLVLSTILFAQVTVNGYIYLENQTDQSGIQVLFERTDPSSLPETATTEANGHYIA